MQKAELSEPSAATTQSKSATLSSSGHVHPDAQQADQLERLLDQYVAARHAIFRSQMAGNGVPEDLARVVGRSGGEIDQLVSTRASNAINKKYQLLPSIAGRAARLDFDFEHFYAVPGCRRCLDINYLPDDNGPSFLCRLKVSFGKSEKDDVAFVPNDGSQRCFGLKAVVPGSGENEAAPNQGAFDQLQELQLLYGREKRNSTSVIWRHPPKAPADFAFLDTSREAVVHVVSTLKFREGSTQKLFLVTAASFGENNGCRACTELIGVAEFRLVNQSWHLDAFNPFCATGGGFGSDPGIDLLKIGRDQVGLRLNTADMAQGQEEETIQVLAAEGSWIGRVLVRGSASSGCVGFHPQACWSNKTTLQFLPNERSDYYDLRLTTTGTQLSEHGREIVPAIKTETLALAGHAYR